MFIKVGSIDNYNKLFGNFVLDTTDMVVEFVPKDKYRQIKKSVDVRDKVLGKLSDVDRARLMQFNACNRKLQENDTLEYGYDFYDKNDTIRLLSVIKPSTMLLRYVYSVEFRARNGRHHVHNVYVGLKCAQGLHELIFLLSEKLSVRVDDKGYLLRDEKPWGRWIDKNHSNDIIIHDPSVPFNFIKQVFMNGNVNFLNAFFDGNILSVNDLGGFIEVTEAINRGVICNL